MISEMILGVIIGVMTLCGQTKQDIQRAEALREQLMEEQAKVRDSYEEMVAERYEEENLDPISRYLRHQDESVQQVCLTIGDGSAWGATFYMYERDEDGKLWHTLVSCDADIGKNGFSDHTYEGDMTTPTGRYRLGLAFGNRSNPGTVLEWVDVNPYHYWVDDNTSAYYNQLIDSREVPDGWNSGEHLCEFVNSYAYAINIEVNNEASTDSTSAIFLHCYGTADYSFGCVAIPESQMITVLQEIVPDTYLTIVRNEEELLNYLEDNYE